MVKPLFKLTVATIVATIVATMAATPLSTRVATVAQTSPEPSPTPYALPPEYSYLDDGLTDYMGDIIQQSNDQAISDANDAGYQNDYNTSSLDGATSYEGDGTGSVIKTRSNGNQYLEEQLDGST